jgi:hypothetical protein
MIGPLPTAPGGFNRVLVAIDKFTKWIKVKPVTCPKADRVLDFLDELVHRYELPHRVIKDLGSNFNNNQFRSTARIVGLKSDMSQSPIQYVLAFFVGDTLHEYSGSGAPPVELVSD